MGNKEKLKKALKTYNEILKMFGEKVAIPWFLDEYEVIHNGEVDKK